MTDERSLNTADKKPSKLRGHALTLSAAVAGMIIGAVVEMFVQGAMESTGWFGPTLEQVVEEQVANFTAIQEKLDTLAATDDESERQRLIEEIERLVVKQESLTGRTHDELRAYEKQVTSLKKQALETSGVAGGADFWLVPGESVALGDEEHILALTRLYDHGMARVTFAGQSRNMNPGDALEFKAGDTSYKLFYSQATEAETGRAGFNLAQADN